FLPSPKEMGDIFTKLEGDWRNCLLGQMTF
ncbi:MAG: hypothetical protein ACI8YQ_004606, partial [Polaribacter sp.]